MPRPRKAPPRPEDLPTIWEVPDALWARIAPQYCGLGPASGEKRFPARRSLVERTLA